MNIEEKLDNKPCNGCGAMTEHGCPEMKDCLEYHYWNDGINSKSDRDIIVALFHRIGEQLELKKEWAKLPNAERSAMAGDFYNIIKMHTSAEVLDANAIDILKRLADEEPECKSSLSDMVRMLWDDYCDSHGEPDVEIG